MCNILTFHSSVPKSNPLTNNTHLYKKDLTFNIEDSPGGTGGSPPTEIELARTEKQGG